MPANKHALEAARAALAFRTGFRQAAAAKPESLGKIDLRIGISSGVVVATKRDDSAQSDIVVSGEPVRSGAPAGPRRTKSTVRKSSSGRAPSARRAKISWPGRLIFSAARSPHERLEVYELLALTENATAEEILRRDRFWTAIVFFRERRWNEALAEFQSRPRRQRGSWTSPCNGICAGSSQSA